MVAIPSVAQAQQAAGAAPAEKKAFGVHVSWADDADFGVGAHLNYPANRLFGGQPIFAQVAVDWFFPGSDITYLELNWNLNYRFSVQSSIRPYAGAGLNIAYADGNCGADVDCSDTEFGLNLVGGVDFKPMGKLTPFVQGRFELSGGEQFVLSGGVHF
jgi:opacity protein-like surface antigen